MGEKIKPAQAEKGSLGPHVSFREAITRSQKIKTIPPSSSWRAPVGDELRKVLFARAQLAELGVPIDLRIVDQPRVHELDRQFHFLKTRMEENM
jgi:hypothetical protein